MKFSRRLATVALSLALGAGIGAGIGAPAHADGPVSGYDPFYDDPAGNLGAPGTLLRTQPAPHLLNVFGPNFPGAARKILYTSTTVHGDPVATSGFVIEPTTPWRGGGPTPTVVFAPGTRGTADACAPSRGPWLTGQVDPSGPAVGLNYELPAYHAASLQGMRVVVVDYIGLGTPGPHTYALHEEEGHAVLDAARAVVPAGEPVAFYGYSQGGGAAAAAAELQPTYAPKINLRGTYAGAPPADLLATTASIEGSALQGFPFEGWKARYPELGPALDQYINPRGHQFLASTANSCVLDGMARWGFTDSRTLTTTSESITEISHRDDTIRGLFDAQKLGRRAPTSPIMVSTSGGDDVVPAGQVVQLARDYCAAGAPVSLSNGSLPAVVGMAGKGAAHAFGGVAEAPASLRWLQDRFNGVPAGSNCGQF